jgi:hypothetical protein
MSDEEPTYLKYLEDLQVFTQMFQETLNLGYNMRMLSFGSLPIDICLEMAVDLMLLLRSLIANGSQTRARNKGLMFSEEYQDTLGNPKQIVLNYPSKFIWDPRAEDYFFRLAKTFISIKDGKDLQSSFMELGDFLGLSSKKNVSSKSMPKGKRNDSKKTQYWWRRQVRRSRRTGQNLKL